MLVAIKLMVDLYMMVDLRMTFRLIFFVGKSVLKNEHFDNQMSVAELPGIWLCSWKS